MWFHLRNLRQRVKKLKLNNNYYVKQRRIEYRLVYKSNVEPDRTTLEQKTLRKNMYLGGNFVKWHPTLLPPNTIVKTSACGRNLCKLVSRNVYGNKHIGR